MTELVTYGSVGGGGSNPAPYPAADAGSLRRCFLVAIGPARLHSAFGDITRMAIQKSDHKEHPLIGSWINGDEYATEVEYTVSGKEPSFQVRAVDRYDGEVGEVRDVSYEDSTSTLSFAVYWTSTGRFIKVRLVAISPNRVSYTYTFTENQMWFRKGTEPDASPL